MNRQRKIDEELWEDGAEKLSADHVVERFFSQHEHDEDEDAARRGRATGRVKRKTPATPGNDD